jgi:DNA-binding CsgD family transcriptional regulator
VFVIELMAQLLAAGMTRAEISRRTGLSPSRVSRMAARLGHAPAASRSSRFDWPAIQAFYDEGHTLRDCRERFGVSAGACDSAVIRGDLVLRPRPGVRPPGATRRAVERLLADGLTQAAVARELGISAPTVCYHARALGIAATSGCSRRYDWAAVQAAHDAGLSVRGCIARFGFSSQTWHAAKKRGAIVPRPAAMGTDNFAGRNRRRGAIAAG